MILLQCDICKEPSEKDGRIPVQIYRIDVPEKNKLFPTILKKYAEIDICKFCLEKLVKKEI